MSHRSRVIHIEMGPRNESKSSSSNQMVISIRLSYNDVIMEKDDEHQDNNSYQEAKDFA